MAHQITGHYTSGGYSARNASAAIDLPELFWRMTETAGTKLFDATGNNNAGTLAGTFTTGVTGVDADTGITFNGSTGKATSSKAGHGGDLAIECWMKLENNPATSDRFLFGIDTNPANVRCRVFQKTGTNQIYAEWKPDASHFLITSALVTLDSTNWHHIVFQFTSSTHKLELFSDGSSQWSTTHDATAGDPAAISGGDGFGTFCLAAAAGGSAFSGSSFQKAAMYSAALSSGRVSSHYSGTTGTTNSQSLTATSSGSATMTRAATYGRTLSATSSSTASLAVGDVYAKTVAATAGSSPSLSLGSVVPKALTASSGSSPSLAFITAHITETLSATSGHSASISTATTYGKSLAATSSHTASVDTGLVGYVPQGLQVDVYAPDNTTMLATLEGAREVNFQDQANACGSGTFRINVNDPKATAANLQRGNIVKVRLNGIYRFAFFIEENQWVVHDSAGKGTEDVTIAGRGLLAYLERAIVYPHGWPSPTGTGYQYANARLATALLDFIIAARNRGALSQLTWNFDALHDSRGAAWTDSNSFQVSDGVSLLDLLTNTLVPLGLKVRMGLDLNLHAYVSQGTNRTSTVILRGGRHIGGGQAQVSEHNTALRSRLVVSGSSNVYAEVADSSLESDPQIGRREGYISANAATNSATLANAGLAEIAFIKAQAQPLQVPVIHGRDAGNYEPYVDYDLGDTIALSIPGTAYVGTHLPIAAMTFTQRPDGDYTVALDLQAVQIDPLVRLNELNQNLTTPTGGGSLGGPDTNLPLSGATPYLNDTGCAQYDPSIDPSAPPKALWTKTNPCEQDCVQLQQMADSGQFASEIFYDPNSPCQKATQTGFSDCCGDGTVPSTLGSAIGGGVSGGPVGHGTVTGSLCQVLYFTNYAVGGSPDNNGNQPTDSFNLIKTDGQGVGTVFASSDTSMARKISEFDAGSPYAANAIGIIRIPDSAFYRLTVTALFTMGSSDTVAAYVCAWNSGWSAGASSNGPTRCWTKNGNGAAGYYSATASVIVNLTSGTDLALVLLDAGGGNTVNPSTLSSTKGGLTSLTVERVADWT